MEELAWWFIVAGVGERRKTGGGERKVRIVIPNVKTTCDGGLWGRWW